MSKQYSTLIGPFVAALEYAADVKADIVGKPAPEFFLLSIADIGCQPSQCVMIGDDIKDDVDGAQSVGMLGILVKTGKYRENDENKISPLPFKVVDNFSEAVNILIKILDDSINVK